jgi:hypothetical protein
MEKIPYQHLEAITDQRSATLMQKINSTRAPDMGWPDLLVSDAMVMMAADDYRG